MRSGRSARPELRELLPWAPTLLGVCALIVLLIIAATRFAAGPQAAAAPPVSRPFLPAPSSTGYHVPPSTWVPVGTGTASPSAPAAATRTARPISPAPSIGPAPHSPSPSRTVRPTVAPQAPALVTGRYRVIDSYQDAFIAEVLVSNTAGDDRDWRVELRFPAEVGDLITSWVESAPQATLTRSGSRYIWSSGVPVAAHADVPLRFHFSRTGTGNLPSTCTVNGAACGG